VRIPSTELAAVSSPPCRSPRPFVPDQTGGVHVYRYLQTHIHSCIEYILFANIGPSYQLSPYRSPRPFVPVGTHDQTGGVHTYTYIYIQYTYIHAYIYIQFGISYETLGPLVAALTRRFVPMSIGLHTILPLPILYGVWHTKEGRGGVVYCKIVVQKYCNQFEQCRLGGHTLMID